MKKTILLLTCLLCLMCSVDVLAQIPFGKGMLTVKAVARNAVRIQYREQPVVNDSLPDWLYVKHDEMLNPDIQTVIDAQRQQVRVMDKTGKTIFTGVRHQMNQGEATLAFKSEEDECLFGLGQFQDDYSNVRGLTRRLTQVNTQISIPMLLSSKGYGILWNNYGLTDFNPADHYVTLEKSEAAGKREVVNVTSTDGGRQEIREQHIYEGLLDIDEAGDYSLMLDVGQKMAR